MYIVSLRTGRLFVLFSVYQQTKLLDSKSMLYALSVNFENFGHTTKNTIFRRLPTEIQPPSTMRWTDGP